MLVTGFVCVWFNCGGFGGLAVISAMDLSAFAGMVSGALWFVWFRCWLVGFLRVVFSFALLLCLVVWCGSLVAGCWLLAYGGLLF